MERMRRVTHGGNVGDDPVSAMYGELERVIERHIAMHTPGCSSCQAPAVKRKWDQ